MMACTPSVVCVLATREHGLLGAGPKCETEEIKLRIAALLCEEVDLELSQPKMLITYTLTRQLISPV